VGFWARFLNAAAIWGGTSIVWNGCMETNAFFVYGTLKSGFCRQSAWPFPPESIQTAYVQGKLFDLGPYPGLGEGEEWVRGEIWTIEPRYLKATLQVLDQIEGYEGTADDLYQRKIATAYQEDGTTVQAYAYFFSQWKSSAAKHIAPNFVTQLNLAKLSHQSESPMRTIQYSAWFANSAESQNPNA